MSRAYVVACYFGPRRVHDKVYEANPLDYINHHLYQLRHLDHEFDAAFFVINGKVTPNQRNAIDVSLAGLPTYLVQRDNIGMSYGAWNCAMTTFPEFDYYFLIEDDYIPIVDTFDAIFMREFKKETAYVCSLYHQQHAAITNGMVKRSAIEATGGIPFAPSANYGANEAVGQIGWSRILDRAGYGIEHIAPKYSVPFLDAKGGIIYYGNPSGTRVISPIALERGNL